MTQKERGKGPNRVREALGRIYDHYPPYFREYLRRFQEDPTSRVFAPLAEAYRRFGRIEDAIEICREGLQHHPDFYGGRVILAKCYIDRKMYTDARSELEGVVQAVPENLLAQRLLGDVFYALKERDQALHAYKMALLLAPNDVALSERVHLLERGVIEPQFQPETRNRHANDSEESDVEVFEMTSAAPATGGNVSTETMEELPPEADALNAASTWNVDEGIVPLPSAPEMEGGDEDFKEHPVVSDILAGGSSENDTSESDGFSVEHVSRVFSEKTVSKKEITTQTLAELYLSQGQFDKSLNILEKLYAESPSVDISKKIDHCRRNLGVQKEQLARHRKIEVLKRILKTVRA